MKDDGEYYEEDYSERDYEMERLTREVTRLTVENTRLTGEVTRLTVEVKRSKQEEDKLNEQLNYQSKTHIGVNQQRDKVIVAQEAEVVAQRAENMRLRDLIHSGYNHPQALSSEPSNAARHSMFPPPRHDTPQGAVPTASMRGSWPQQPPPPAAAAGYAQQLQPIHDSSSHGGRPPLPTGDAQLQPAYGPSSFRSK